MGGAGEAAAACAVGAGSGDAGFLGEGVGQEAFGRSEMDLVAFGLPGTVDGMVLCRLRVLNGWVIGIDLVEQT